jgi:hypothetical protein
MITTIVNSQSPRPSARIARVDQRRRSTTVPRTASTASIATIAPMSA